MPNPKVIQAFWSAVDDLHPGYDYGPANVNRDAVRQRQKEFAEAKKAIFELTVEAGVPFDYTQDPAELLVEFGYSPD